MILLNYILGITGSIASIFGLYFTYISFINPIRRFNCFLSKSDNWEKFIGVENNLSIYRHKRYPNFQIVVDWSESVAENFHEEWIHSYPDNEHNASYFVRLESNGMLLDKEPFVSLDGGRYFVPVPRIEMSKTEENKREFYYDKRQVQLANVIGEFYLQGDDIHAFMSKQNEMSKINLEVQL